LAAPADIYTLSLHDALPICHAHGERRERCCAGVRAGTLQGKPDSASAGLRVAKRNVALGGVSEELAPADTRAAPRATPQPLTQRDRKSTRLNSSHVAISYAV